MFDPRRAGAPNDDRGYVETDPTGRYGRFKDILGKGAMKIVYRAFDELEGMEVAWNQANVFDVMRSPEALERLYTEVHLLSTLHHSSVIRFLASWVDGAKRTFNFITELFTSGTLREYRQKYRRVDIRAVKSWARQILEGLVYLHSHDPPVIHRDLKCDNIFINGHLGQVKIGDLGLAAVLKGSQPAHSVIGTPEFMAPELYEEEYNELVDVYSFGMCVLEMLTGEYPYCECCNPAQIYKKVTMGKLPSGFHKIWNPEAKRFIGMCLQEASKRPSAKELLQDPFLRSEDDDSPPSHRSAVHGVAPENHFFLQLPVLKQSKSAHTDIKITGKLNPNDDTVFLRVQILDRHGHSRNIYFAFDIIHDTSADVAHEMVKELEITDLDPSQISVKIDQVISTLVPNWKDEAPESSHHSYSFQEEEVYSSHHPVHYPSSPTSSQSSSYSPTYSRESNGGSSRNWLQDIYPDEDDDTTSQTSMQSGDYSFSSDRKNECEMDSQRPDAVLTAQMKKPSSQSDARTEHPPDGNKQRIIVLEPAAAPSRKENRSSMDRKISRNRSLVDLRSQMLHQKLVEEVNKRMANTIGAMEDIGYQNPYEASSKGKKKPSNFHGAAEKNSGCTWRGC